MNKPLLYRILPVLLAAVLVLASCREKEAPYFVQISDPQLGFINFSEDFSPEMEIMERMIPQVNGLDADFIVVSGDLVHKRSDSCALEAFKGLLGKFRKDLKMYCLPGNHDVGNEALPQEVGAFVERYGSDRFVHKEKTYTVIGYNSCVVKARTEAEDAEYRWLEEQLKGADAGNPVIVVAHHPIFLDNPDEPETYETLPVEMRMKYLQLFEKYGVDVYLAGHLHKCASGEYNGIQLITSSAAGRQLGEQKSGYSIVKIEDGNPVVEYVEMDSSSVQ